jgi:hypothetical protein
MYVGGSANRVITVYRCFHSVAICDVVFSEKGVNEHFLINPELTGLKIVLKLDAEEGA